MADGVIKAHTGSPEHERTDDREHRIDDPQYKSRVFDAWANRRPVIVYGVDAVNTIVQDGINGVVVPPRNPVARGQAIRGLLESPSVVQELAEKGYEEVRRTCDPDIVRTRVAEIYERLLA